MLANDCINLTLEYLNDFEIPVRIYTLLTIICTVLDIISAFVFLILTGNTGSVFTGTTSDTIGQELNDYDDKLLHGMKLFFVSMYFYLDLIYIAYIIHFVLKLPKDQRIYTAKAFFGFGEELRISFYPSSGST